MEQDEVASCANQEQGIVMVEDVEDLTMMEVGLEDDQVKPGSCSLWTWAGEDTHMKEPHDDEDMVEAELEVDQVEPGSCSLSTWMDEDTHMGKPHDEDSMEAELEGDQVEPGSCSLSTWMGGVTHMKEPHIDKVSMDICVSFGHLEDGLCAGKGKISLPRQEDILPWMTMMEPCMKEQGLLPTEGLVEVACNLMMEGTRARDKGGT